MKSQPHDLSIDHNKESTSQVNSSSRNVSLGSQQSGTCRGGLKVLQKTEKSPWCRDCLGHVSNNDALASPRSQKSCLPSPSKPPSDGMSTCTGSVAWISARRSKEKWLSIIAELPVFEPAESRSLQTVRAKKTQTWQTEAKTTFQKLPKSANTYANLG